MSKAFVACASGILIAALVGLAFGDNRTYFAVVAVGAVVLLLIELRPRRA